MESDSHVSATEAQEEHSRDIWEIRYHPEINKTAFYTEIVAFATHDSWYKKKYFSGLPNKCFILSKFGKAVGYCRLDKNDEGEYLVSIAVLPEYHGQGLGYLLLSQSLPKLTAGEVAVAEIKIGNSPSLKLFQKSGFTIVREDNEKHVLKRVITTGD